MTGAAAIEAVAPSAVGPSVILGKMMGAANRTWLTQLFAISYTKRQLFPLMGAKMKLIKPVTAATLAVALGAEQILNHGEDHIPEEGGAPEPHQVRPAITTAVTTPAPESVKIWSFGASGWEYR